MDADALAALDQEGYDVLESVAYDRAPREGSLATPHAFVFSDNHTYWVKRRAQQGLIAELVAGRLGKLTSAAPPAGIVEVVSEAMPDDNPPNHLLGIGVGVRDEPNMENTRLLSQHFRPDNTLDPSGLDARAGALVATFQTWIGVGDVQILVDMTNGRLLSIDHGECFADPSQRTTPTVVQMPNVPGDFGRRRPDVMEAVERIEAIADETLLQVLARVPSAPEWNSDPARRLAIAEWLAWRRDRLREVMEPWSQ